MSACPDPARISAAASGEDLAVEAHAADCASCRDMLSAERSVRSLAGRLPPYTLSTDRRRALEASIVAHAERRLDVAHAGRVAGGPHGERRADRSGRTPRRARPLLGRAFRGRALLGRAFRGRALLAAALLAAALLAAAALVIWRALPSSSPSSPPPPAAVAAPRPPPSPPPVVVPLSPEPAPRLTPGTGARFERVPASDRDVVFVTDGTLAVDATTSEQAISLTDRAATPLSVRAEGARLEVRASRGAIHSVQVFAGSVEITHQGRTIVVTAGATWTAPETSPPDTVRLPDTAASVAAGPDRDLSRPDRDLSRRDRDLSRAERDLTRADRDLSDGPGTDPTAFADGWRAYRAGDLDAAAVHFARATSDPAVAEDATYWLAAAHARAGNTALAITTYDQFLAHFPSSPHAGAAHLALTHLLAATDPARADHHRAAAAADPDPRIRAAASR